MNRAAAANHAPPPAFRGYAAHVESELSLVMRDSLGRERAAQIEQLASSVEWTRGGAYAMRIVGYRQQNLGSVFSALSFLRGWTEPSLYGERLRLGALVGDTSARRRDSIRTDTVVAVHPFASDRERFYRFSGGDTLTVLRTGARAITIVRLRVSPRFSGDTRLAALDGEIDLDAERHEIVRIRGSFVVLGPRRAARSVLARMPGLVAVAYCEFVNTEVNGRYWLPAFQRTELQSTSALLGKSRAVMRIQSTFSDYTVDDTSTAIVDTAHVDRIPRLLTWAPSDSIDRFRDWIAPLGGATSGVHADDFDDFAPDRWKATGRPRLDVGPTRLGNVLRFDRVEGLFTGQEVSLQLRDRAPGVTVGGHGGVAWTERTLRGGAHVSLRRGAWTHALRAERELATTNDFRRPFDAQSGGIAALLGVDDFDYVDRRLAVASAARVIGTVDNAIVSMQLGAGNDQQAPARLTKGAIGHRVFRPNRHVAEGTYVLGSADVELHPGMSGDFVQPGIGARAHYEIGRGALNWQRAEVSVSGRRYPGPLSIAMEATGGAVLGSTIPPQTLFEIGGSRTLPGYEYKEFAGDRAALFRGFAAYSLPIWRAPVRLRRSLVVPGLAPDIAVGVQGGWTELSSVAARSAAGALSAMVRPTNGVRATVGVGMTFLGGMVHVGAVRAIDRTAPWRMAVGFGPSF